MRYTLCLALAILLLACEKQAPTDAQTPACKVTAPSGLVLRDRPDRAARKLVLMPPGAVVALLDESGPQTTIDGKTGAWYQVRWLDPQQVAHTGWAFSAWLEKLAAAPAEAEDMVRDLTNAPPAEIGPDIRDPLPGENLHAVMEEKGLTLHEHPRPEQPLAQIPQGTLVEVLATDGPLVLQDGICDTWYRIRHAGREGWAFGGYLQPLGRDYSIKQVVIKDVNLQTSTDNASVETESDDYIVLRNPKTQAWPVDFKKDTDFNAWADSNLSKGIRCSLILADDLHFAGVVAPDGRQHALQYCRIKPFRHLGDPAKIRTRITKMEYAGSHGDGSIIITTAGAFRILFFPEFLVISKRFSQKSIDTLIRDARLVTIRYLPAAELGKYRISTSLTNTQYFGDEDESTPFLGMPLAIE